MAEPSVGRLPPKLSPTDEAVRPKVGNTPTSTPNPKLYVLFF